MTFYGQLPKHWLDRVEDDGDCVVWTGWTKDGYGHANVAGKRVRVHRWLWEQVNGPVPAGLVLDHLCNRRACLRPDHLVPATIGDNAARPKREQTACMRGHDLADARVRPDTGHRQCRACDREKKRGRRAVLR